MTEKIDIYEIIGEYPVVIMTVDKGINSFILDMTEKIDYGLPRIMMACLYLIWREGNASSM